MPAGERSKPDKLVLMHVDSAQERAAVPDVGLVREGSP